MALLDDFQNLFGAGQAQTGQPIQPAQGQSSFFGDILSGALRGVNQAFSTSDIGRGLSATLTTGQSQSAATNLYGNPLVLLATFAIIGVVVVSLLKR